MTGAAYGIGPEGPDDLERLLEDLLRVLRASRVTLRQDRQGAAVFPVTHEALAAGMPSLREETTVDLATQPVAIEVRAGRQVVQNDSATASDDRAFQRMLQVYGGLAAQIVTPVVLDGSVSGILSVHELGAPREWSSAEVAEASRAAERIAEMLGSR